MRKILFLLLLLSYLSNAQEVHVSNGTLQRFPAFVSKYVDARNVDVWLPDGYSKNETYAVVYMHDGNMLYDASSTWNKQAWEVDEVAGKLMAEKKTKPFIVVGIWNNGSYRHSEYFPEKIIENIPEATRKVVLEEQLLHKPQADNYLKFIVTELKPFIDSHFATKKGRSHTFISGSSMGGLISLYAICEYPKVFGGAACLSMHSPLIMKERIDDTTDDAVASKFRDYLKTHLPHPKHHKIYFDYGDQTLDAFYAPFQKKIDAMMVEKGFSSKNWVTRFFQGKDHSENAWKERLDIPLLFLLKR